MGMIALVLGKSGSGKSTSLRNFEPNEVGVISVLGKPLPFRKKLDTFNTDEYRRVLDCLHSGKRPSWVVDDATYLMQNENFKRAKETGYAKFTDMALNFQRLIKAAIDTQEGTITYLMMHSETDEHGHEKVKTIGKMLDEKYCIEGACPIVINCEVRDGKHVFVTENDGTNLAKAPMGMLPPVMDNDLKAVDEAIRDYWGWPRSANETKE